MGGMKGSIQMYRRSLKYSNNQSSLNIFLMCVLLCKTSKKLKNIYSVKINYHVPKN